MRNNNESKTIVKAIQYLSYIIYVFTILVVAYRNAECAILYDLRRIEDK